LFGNASESSGVVDPPQREGLTAQNLAQGKKKEKINLF